MGQNNPELGSVKRNRAFIVHPDDIKKSLKVGEAFYATKIGQFNPDKVKIKYSSPYDR